MPGPFLTNPLYYASARGNCSGTDREFKSRRRGGRTYIHTPANRSGQGKVTQLDEVTKRFAILQNLLVLNGKLQYPALAANPSTGVGT